MFTEGMIFCPGSSMTLQPWDLIAISFPNISISIPIQLDQHPLVLFLTSLMNLRLSDKEAK